MLIDQNSFSKTEQSKLARPVLLSVILKTTEPITGKREKLLSEINFLPSHLLLTWYMYFCICICVFVFVRLYFCICICAFVFVF